METTNLQTYTAEDLLNLPEDGFRYELVRGELIKMALPGAEHGRNLFLTEEDTLDGGDVVPEWTIPVKALFV
jgi:Uma2 family endonuclease